MMPVRLASLLCVLVLLTGCASTLVATADVFCMPDANGLRPLQDVCVSREDELTEKTAQSIEANNLALRRICKRKSQCPAPTGKAKPADKSEPKTS